MFTGRMYEKLADWLTNVSVLFLGSVVVPFFSEGQLVVRSLIGGGILTMFSLWLALRLIRISERGER